MSIQYIILAIFTQIRSIFLTMKHMFAKRETRLYPDHSVYLSPRYRGRIVLTKNPDGKERCVACNLCSVVCPVSCISLQKSQNKFGRWFPLFFRINFSRCIFCGLCEEACPTAAIQLIPDFELSDFNRKDLVYKKNDLSILGTGKYHNYNFYEKTGVYNQIDTSTKNSAHSIPVNIKDLLP
ncbi:NADH-quinone oxidoreductase subunit NuoI [Buchnera aphidicola]|uniref:NADH-quinone oxidoreductase subunit I n=1 Tax=Buchnera aphidicola (Sarucallis kahawaluokalani) TaxID=1241878 RepID=A0A4D6Y7L6_9GAMM|nr:NADH-quinone oxidoreductase subunit NuoI [Buchnera aphidicola]QCI25916.1 NADH-quinone oxidoreductase subunit NuoI [Buchnera aphidicola (Sarucallis kahawaluokalani)]